jgi:hypothetical protein
MRWFLVILLVLGLLIVPGCGSATVSLDDYRTAVNGWLTEYKPKVNNAVDGIEAIENPLTPTDSDLNAAKTLVQVLRDAANAFDGISPTTDLASAHQTLVQSLRGMADGAQQFYDGLQAKDASKVIDAFNAIGAASDSGTAAKDTLQQSLGIQLD